MGTKSQGLPSVAKGIAVAFDRSIKFAPSILPADFADSGREIQAIEAQGAGGVHADVMDGHFVPNLTFGPPAVRAFRPHIRTVMGVHLMIAPVDPFIQGPCRGGCGHHHRPCRGGSPCPPYPSGDPGHREKAGIALDPGTPVKAVG